MPLWKKQSCLEKEEKKKKRLKKKWNKKKSQNMYSILIEKQSGTCWKSIYICEASISSALIAVISQQKQVLQKTSAI